MRMIRMLGWKRARRHYGLRDRERVDLSDDPRGYVLRTEILGDSISNERLERMIDHRKAFRGAVAC